jgi:glycosidase
MTYRGAPMIYYGDEIGMWGADDPHDRKPMIWDNFKYEDEVINKSSGFKKGFGTYKIEQNRDLLNFYKKIGDIHNNNLSLQKGSFRFIYSNDDKGVVAFERKLGGEWILCLFNSGNEKVKFKLPLESEKLQYQNLWNGEQGMISSGESSVLFDVEMNPASFKIYKLYPAL